MFGGRGGSLAIILPGTAFVVDQEDPSEHAPTPFGKYLLDREIARGGMARVYSARLRGLGGFEKRLVVKQILPHLAEDPRFVEMFVHEAKTLVALSHPHVVPVYELGIEGGIYFLAMEHVEGATLADILASGPLSDADVAHVGVQVADALAYADERFGLVHRDVTPRNVMVDGSGHARLLDFGIAARTDDPEREGGLYGTPGYLSPEQARGEKVSAASDLFSLGCVLFEASTGAPFAPGRELGPIRELTADDVAARVPDDTELSRVVRRCLAPRAEDRPDSARTLGRLLRSVMRGADDPARALGERAEAARARSRKKGAPDAPRDPAGTPTSDPARPSATLATSQLLGALLEGTAKIERAQPASDGGTRRIEGRSSAGASSEGPATPATHEAPDAAPGTRRLSPAPDAAPRPIGWLPLIAASAVLGGIAVFFASRAQLDPPVPDASEVLTDTDGTMFIPAEDTGPDAASVDAAAETDVTEALDAGLEADAGSDAGREPSRRASLRVTSDGSLTVRVDGREVGHAPIATSIPAGERRLTFDCDYLGRSAEETVTAEAGATLRVRVTCNTTPPRVVIGH